MSLIDGAAGVLLTNLIFALLFVAMTLAFYRLVRGRSTPDRVIALDLISAIAVSITALYAIVTHQRVLLDVAISIALITFLGTVAFAQYIERRARND